MDGEELTKIEDEKTPVMRAIEGLAVGLFPGLVTCFINPNFHCIRGGDVRLAPPGSIQRLKIICRHGATGAAIAGTWFGVEQAMQNYRLKRDFINGAVGAFVAGATVFGYNSRSISTACNKGALMSLIAASFHPLRSKMDEVGK